MIAIVTTTRGAGRSLASFIRTHLHLGFGAIYLFFDDPQDDALALAAQFPQVQVTVHDAALQARWRGTRLFQRRRQLNPEFVMDRQMLNAAVAIEMGVADGVDWLLHIDQDELFYAAELFEGQSLTGLFERLSAEHIQHVNFANLEAIPESADVADPFREVTLFKRNPRSMDGMALSAEQQAIINPLSQMPPHFFHNYVNGKSAARVSADLLPDGVHDFHLPQQQTTQAAIARKLRRHDPFTPHHRWVVNPVILHYLNCSFDAFYAKYSRYDYYNAFRNPQRMLGKFGQFHANAANAVQRGEAAARDFYAQHVMLTDPTDQQRLLDSQLATRINAPANWLAHSTHEVLHV